jgi:DNA primase
MKKITRILGYLQVIILWSLCAPLFAQNVSVHLISNRDSVGTEGDIIRMPIIMDTIYTNDVVAENIIAMNLVFDYGQDLTPISFTTGGGMLSSWQVNTNVNKTTRKFSFTAAGVNPISLDSGLLFYVDFLLGDVNNVTNPTFSLSTASDNYLNEGGYDFTMDYGQIKINPILQLNVSASPVQITDGDSTKIYVSGGTAPYTYSVTNPTFGGFVSIDYFLAAKYGMAEVQVVDANGLQGSTTVEVRPFRLDAAGPATPVFPGNDFQIAIITTDVSQLNAISGSFDFTITNVTNVRLKGIIDQGTLLEGASIELNEKTPYNYSLAFANANPLSAGDTLLKVEFESDIDAVNSYNLSLQNNIVFNDDLLGTRGSSSAAQFINIIAPNLSYPFNNYIRNEQIQFTGSAGQAPYTWSVSDETIGIIDGEGLLTLLKGGNISVTITDSLGISKSTDLFIYDARVDIADHTVPVESQYKLPVEITELAADRGFSSFFFEITYDPTKVGFVGLDRAGTLLEGFTIAQNQIASNIIRIVGASSVSQTSAGILTNLTFDLLPEFTEGQITGLSFSKITFNEGEPVPIAINGIIKVGIAPTTGATDLTIDEDEKYVFQQTDFVYDHADPNKPLTYIKLESLPSNGTLYLNTSPITTLTTISVVSFSTFSYQPNENESGIDYDLFEFKVNDGTNFSNYNGTISIDVNAVNDNPSFEVSESFVTVQEDFVTPSVVMLTPNAVPTDEQGETVTFSISPESVDFAEVVFDANALTITFSSIADSSGTQVFTITADDGKAENNTFDKLVTLTVQRVNDAPTFNDQTFAIDENLGNGSLVTELVSTDKDSDISFAIIDGNVNNAFALSTDGILTVNDVNALDFETTPVFTLSINVMDEETTVSATVTINLNDIDEAVNQEPQIIAQTFSLDENSVNGSAVGTVSAFDPDGDVLTLSITAGNTNNAFGIDEATGLLTVANVNQLDFETTPTFSLTVQVADAALNASAVITINLNDVLDTNQPPTITNQTFSIDENSANGTEVGTVVASDPDSDALMYSITSGNNNDAFVIDSSTGSLTVANVAAFDFETNPTFTLTVQVADAELNASATITINLNDVDESINQAPQISNQTFTIDENSANGTEVATVIASDPEGDALTYSITAGNTNDAFVIDSSTGSLTVANVEALDFETNPTFALTVQVADAELNTSATITINLNDLDESVNQAPQISNQTFTIDENSANGTEVGTAVASDPDSDALMYSITSGNTNDAFAIDASTGALTVANVAALDFETNPTLALTVQVADAELNASATITINLNDVDESTNQAPQISDQTFSIDENSANGTEVGTVVASDPDSDALMYSITSGNTNDAFVIDSSTGSLTVANVAELDFETNPTFALTVQVADAELNASATITINLNDVDESVNQAPQINNQTFAIDENSANGTEVATVIASDPEGDALTYSITAGNTNDAFVIDSSTGSLTVANVEALDFETNPTFALTVQVADAELNASATITINLNDVDESVNQAPVINNQAFNLEENSADGTFVGIIQGSDSEGDALTYAITAGNQLDGFILDPNSGLLSVADQGVMDFETNPSFNLTVTVSDGSLDANATISILLTDVTNEEEALLADMKAQLNIYPNPAKSMITIEGISYDLLVISDLSGKKLMKTQASVVDVSSLKTGTYMMTFHLDNGETITKRMMKE